MDWSEALSKLGKNPSAAQEAMQSGDGQELLRRLCAADGGKSLQAAAAKAAAGDTAELSRLLKSVLASDEGEQLAQRLGKRFQ